MTIDTIRRLLSNRLQRVGLMSLACILALSLVMGFALSWLLTSAAMTWECENTAAFARREADRVGLEALLRAPDSPAIRERWAHAMAGLFAGFREIVRVKAWDGKGTVLWSDEQRLIGQRFTSNDELARALAGTVAVEIKRLSKAENVYEKGFDTLAEIYVPIFAKDGGAVIGVLEIYKTPFQLLETVRRGRLVIWTISIAGGGVLFLILLPVFRRGYIAQEEAHRLYAERLEAEVSARTGELRQAEEQLAQAKKMEAIGQLAGGVAHDFNNLLTVIIGRVEFLKLRGPGGAAFLRDVELIEKTARRAAELTGQLLAFSRKQILRPSVIDLNDVIRNTEKLLRRLIGEDISLVTELAPGLAHIKADPGQMQQVLVNLAVNARDAMPRGGQLTVTTASVQPDRRDPAARGRVMLAVRDNGDGMAADVQARIFEPFFTTKGRGRGIGLGLSTVYGIVTQSGGEISVQSLVGTGTVFTITLPATTEAAETAGSTPEPLPPGQETILLVEDEEDVRAMVGEMLRESGYRVLEAGNGGDAMSLVERHDGPLHLLVTDVIMPGISGPEVARRLAALRPGVKVLYISGYTDDVIGSHGTPDRGVTLLDKPFSATTLLRTVRTVLDTVQA